MFNKQCSSRAIKHIKPKKMKTKASLKFFIPSGSVDSTELKDKIGFCHDGCDYWIPSNGGFVQFSHEFLHLQPSSFISDEILKFLNKNTTKVVLEIPGVPNEKVIKGLQPKGSSIRANNEKDFHIQLGKRKISGIKSPNDSDCFDMLFEGKSSKDVYETFHSFVPGYFPQSGFIPISHFLSGMTFFKRLKLVFDF